MGMIGRLRYVIFGLALLLPLVVACSIFGETLPPFDATAPATGVAAGSMPVPTPVTTPTEPQTSELPPPTPTDPPLPPTVAASPTSRPEPSPTATAVDDEPVVPVLHDLSIDQDDVLVFPVPAVYAGDLVTFHISPNLPGGLAPNDVQVRILLDGEELLFSNIDYRKLSGDVVGLYQWAWDTTDQEGSHTITVELDPEDQLQINDENPNNNVTSLDVIVRPRGSLPAREANAAWVEVAGNCCVLHVVSGTAAQRDIEQLADEVDAAFERASVALATPLSETPYDIYLIDRVIGQGGYAIDDMVISYLDRDYAGGGLQELLVHEAVHLVDKSFAPDRITFLAEGLAVWVAGGHYQQQDIGQRMAALVEVGGYVPIAQIIENFFATQHEIGYLESASLIDYLVVTYGWPRVRAFYAETTADDGRTLTDAVDVNLRTAFGRTLEQIESDWLAYLASLPRDLTAADDLTTTTRYYDVMRRYQTIYDPTAYYLYAWLPVPAEAAERQATADFSRHPESETNIALETMLLSANSLLWQGEYDRVNAILDSVERVLDNEGRFLDPLARAHLNIVRAVSEEGYEVQRIDLDGNRATATAIRPNRTRTVQLQLVMNRDGTWTVRD
jgi:hypothetical protein